MSLDDSPRRITGRRVRHSASSSPRRTSRQPRWERLEDRLCPALALTPAGQALGLTLSTFADGFPSGPTPSGDIGPLGIAFPASGGVLVADGDGAIYRFPTDSDGQAAGSTSITASYGVADAFGLTQFDGDLYMTQQAAGRVVQIDDNGGLVQPITATPVGATGIIPDPFTGHLFVSVVPGSPGAFGGILDVDPVAHAYSVFSTIPVDGMALSADGSTLYGASGYDVIGFRTVDGQEVLDTGPISAAGFTDGLALGAGPLAGNLFVNTQGGTLVEYNLGTGATTIVAAGGSRGDFAAVDPNNSTLLLTQSDSVVRIGGPFLISTNPVPTISTLSPGSAPEGTGDLSLTVTGSDFVPGATVDWDGSPLATAFVDASTLRATVPAADLAEEGSASVTVVNPAPGGGPSGSLTFTITDPAVQPSGGYRFAAVEGATSDSQVVATFTDPGGPEASDLGAYSATIAWGDGQTSVATPADGGIVLSGDGRTFDIVASHRYGEEGTYTITVTVAHEGTSAAPVTSTATVSDPEVVASGVAVTAVECRPFAGTPVATFTDPGGPEPNADDPDPATPAGHYSATIDWGDGQSSAGLIVFDPSTGAFSVLGGHTYEEEGSYQVTTTIDHEGIITRVTSPSIVNENLGILLLDPNGRASLMVTGNGSVTVGNCGAVVVDSAGRAAAFITGNGLVSAGEVDVTGGIFTAGHGAIAGEVDHDPPLPDPLGLATPPAPAPIFGAVHDSTMALTLSSGTYVGGIAVSGQGAVTLLPGVYDLEGGGFSVTGQGSVKGSGVLIVNVPAGPADSIQVSGQGSVDLTPATDLPGPYAADDGITFFQGGASSNPLSFSGQAAFTLTGMVYAPSAECDITGNARVAIGFDAARGLTATLIASDLKVAGNGALSVEVDPGAAGSPMAAHAASTGPTPGGTASPDIQSEAIDQLMRDEVAILLSSMVGSKSLIAIGQPPAVESRADGRPGGRARLT